ncbi:MAG TPA: pilus assembly protein TadG-related protein [Burkholderiaceae bacterium]|nr:pilus assembly protein TadG-related protein [Burkholderiaceae bacterium]
MRRRRGQQGQVLVLAFALLLIAALLMITMFSAGQVVIAKQRLVGATDAAALSAATWRARVLNYHAYANRAIVANEVAIAQAVTLSAWSKYFRTFTDNAAQISSAFPPVYAVLRAVAEAAAASDEAAQWAARIEVPARGAADIGYKEILQRSQEILHLTAGGFGLSAVATEIVRASDRDFFAWTLSDGGAFAGFTRRYDSDEDRQRLKELVLASLDPFVAGPRSADLPRPFPPGCLPLPRLRKRGTTELTPDLERWEAVDTISLHVGRLRLFGCRDGEVLPLGWGAAEADAVGTGALIASGGGVTINPAALQLAEQELESHRPFAGIARVRELSEDVMAASRYPSSRVAVVARHRGARVATALNRALAAGRVLARDEFAPGDGGRYLWALSSAEVYFRRPPGPQHRLELPSLYNPYWQARLVEPSAEERDAAASYLR